jgi:transcriptional regulatory protein LevR
MSISPKEKINQILQSDAINYLETSERLILKNILEKEIISELEATNLDKILQKYKKFIKN